MEHDAYAGAHDSDATVIVGSPDGEVTALRADNGAVLWSVRTGRRRITLAHGGEIIYMAAGDQPNMIIHKPATEEEARRGGPPKITYEFDPTAIEARRAHDGFALWRKAHMRIAGYMTLALDSGLLFADSRNQFERQFFYALDPETGDARWTRDYATLQHDVEVSKVLFQRLVGAHGGHVYLEALYGLAGDSALRKLYALDAMTGAEVWSNDIMGKVDVHTLLSESGAIIAQMARQADGTALLSVLNASDGSVRTTLPLQKGEKITALSDAGIIFVSGEYGGMAAWSISDGSELWRVEAIQRAQLDATGKYLFQAQTVIQNSQSGDSIGEVEAFDAETGERLWQWRSPANLEALLHLWGERTPKVAALFAKHAYDNVAQSLADAIKKRDPGVMTGMVSRELHAGQWRKPHTTYNPYVACGRDVVSVGTRLGLFALDARDGHLLWHALPTTEVSLICPPLA